MSLPSITLDLIEASGLFSFSRAALEEWRSQMTQSLNTRALEAIETIQSSIKKADSTLRESAVQAAKDFESAKEKASEISIASAVEQFNTAQRNFTRRLWFWGGLALITFSLVLVCLVWLYKHPPLLITVVMNSLTADKRSVLLSEPLPLLVATAAYYTSIRLAGLGILGLVFAFSLRMARAYLHLIEHNEHKLRVTRSIQAFVAAVRTGEQKDLVLGKLIESVTEFSDPGILSTQSDSSLVPQSINIGGTPGGSH